MTPKDCPLPEVAEALGPFVKPRDEVARIRQELQAYLQKQTQFDDVPLTTVNLGGPSQNAPLQPSAALSGVQKAYLQALRAHATAQAKYDALKTDLTRLTDPTRLSTSSTGVAGVVKASDTVHANYIPLLRQREKQRKLQAIERAFSGITIAGKEATTGHIDEIVRQRMGDLPTPPTAQPPVFNEKADVEARILQLKKAVLATKRRVDESRVTVADLNRHVRSRPETEVAGLQSALNELTGWMEQQLAIIGDAEKENTSMPPTPMRNGHATPEAASLEYIEAMYEQYLEARRRLTGTVNNPPSLDFVLDVNALALSANAAKDDEKRTTPAEVLLPHVHILASTKQEEQSLLQQSAYLRRQISTAETENHRLTVRLADESHLVHPGASKGKDWAEAASEASRATEGFVMRRLQAGETSADAAQRTLEGIERVPEMLDNMAPERSTR